MLRIAFKVAPESRREKAKRYAKVVAKSLGLKVGKCLGDGSCGTAFLLSDNSVLKITDQEEEFITSSKIVGKSIPHVNYIIGTYDLRSEDNLTLAYAIHQRLVDTSCFDDVYDIWIEVGLTFDLRVLYGHPAYHQKIGIDCVNDRVELYKAFPQYQEFFDELANLCDSLIQHKITAPDIIPANLGYYNGELTMFDLGYSKDGLITKDCKFTTIYIK